MDDKNIYRLFESRFPADRRRMFIETEQGVVYRYEDLVQTSGRYARTLTESGIRKGDRGAVQVDKSPEALFLYLACLRAGFIYLPLNTAYLEDELDYFLGDAEPAAVVCAPARQGTLATLAARHGVAQVLTLDGQGGGSLSERAAGRDEAFDIVPGPDDLALTVGGGAYRPVELRLARAPR